MSDIVIAAIIAAIAPTLVGVAGIIVSWKNRKKIDEVHRTINSGLSRQLDTAEAKGEAEGNLTGRKEQTEERKVEQDKK